MKVFSRTISTLTLALVVCAPTLILATTVSEEIRKTPQNTSDFVNGKTSNRSIISQAEQEQKANEFLQHYFLPWSYNAAENTAQLKKTQEEVIQRFSHSPGYASNQQKHSKEWIKEIAENINFATFPNKNQRAITTEMTPLRALPTKTPSFTDYRRAGHGYPFDDLQESTLPSNLPVRIVHQTKNGAWSLVITHNAMGWTPTEHLATVNNAFVNNFSQMHQHNRLSHFIAPLLDGVGIYTVHQRYLTTTRLGVLYPLQAIEDKHYVILVAARDSNGRAVLKTALLKTKFATEFPYTLTTRNLARITNRLLGQPYGWGGLYGLRDCSATLMDMFTPFGIWLPRNSGAQSKTGHFIDLANMNDKEKIETIIKQGKPWETFLWEPGHIMLYIGTKDHIPYVFHTKWGLPTRSIFKFGKEGRAIIGRAAITPITLGKSQANVILDLLKGTQGMTLLFPQPSQPAHTP